MKTVAIITRTKDRPIMLWRALDSVAGQQYTDFVWVVVNDGGRVEDVQPIVDEALGKGIEVLLISHAQNKGMEAASNAGIEQSESKYVVIHDDDDTWHPAFLEKTVGYMEGGKAAEDCMGVVTRTRRVTEVIRGDRISVIGEGSYNPDLSLITLTEIINLMETPPPISFLYKRELLDRVGNYDSALPVLGDWDFLLRTLSRYTIDVIGDELANYHLRPNIRFGDYGNTVLAQRAKHKAWQSYIIDKYIRQDLQNGSAGLGHLLFQGRSVRQLDEQLYSVRQVTNIVRKMRNFVVDLYYVVRSRFS